ncbi:MAG: peroxide stress protein YaaA [Erysipelotrichaceae bacterium]|nr:peroxide stress protein YaaA [Erysipelotrichaceae bacterium]
MKIILSPAKKMERADDDFAYDSLPEFLVQSEELSDHLKSYDAAQLKKIWKCSDALVQLNQQRIETMDLRKGLSPALFSYIGLAFQHMAPGSMTDSQLGYLREHLRILSGFYGVLRPFDGVTPYRLEMQAVLPDRGSLYDFWGDSIYRSLIDEDRLIINLASKEYSVCVEKYLREEDRMITPSFVQIVKGKPVTKGTMAKMARGEMTWWLAENRITDPEKIRNFNDGYEYSELLSGESEYVFVQKI